MKCVCVCLTFFQVNIEVNPNRLEVNREVFVFKSTLARPVQGNTLLQGYSVLVPIDIRHGNGMWVGFITSGNVLKLKVPALPRSLLVFGQLGQGQDESSGNIPAEVWSALAEAINAFVRDPADGRFWKLINLVFPVGHNLACLRDGDEGGVIPDLVQIGSDHFALFKVANMDEPVTHIVRRAG